MIEQLEALAEPVHLVGHDQGSIISQGVLLERPDLVSSVVLASAIADDDYHWHPTARIWQTPGLGEQSMAQLDTLPVEHVAALLTQMSGLSERDALDVARDMDVTMQNAMLELYRSEPSMADWTLEKGLDYPPTLIVWGEHDHAQDGPRFGGRAAEVTGGRYTEIPGAAHYWMLDHQHEGARLLRDFWKTAG